MIPFSTFVSRPISGRITCVSLVLLSMTFLLLSCHEQPYADAVYYNASIVTMDSTLPHSEALALKGDKILAIGTYDMMEQYVNDQTKKIDLAGKFVMPGFIEGHGHFQGLGASERNVNLLGDTSYAQLIEKVKEKTQSLTSGTWIYGRGWHQEKWQDFESAEGQEYPKNDLLSAISPDHPVMLIHASGHSLMANAEAMRLAGLSSETPEPVGGRIVKDKDGELLGVFEERAMPLIRDIYEEELASRSPKEQKADWLANTQSATATCLSHGITTFQDAGSSRRDISFYRALAENGALNIRMWAMLRHPYSILDTMDLSEFPIFTDDHFFTSRAIKSEVDGALGSYGAWLLKPYSDKPNFHGQNTTKITDVASIADLCLENELQFCVHAIGDRANRVVLDIYENKLDAGSPKRWRIEHAQHLNPKDIPRFETYNVIASIQGVHCTSDAPFVVKRLGEKRASQGAYPWRSLLDAGVRIANGTDAPVESVDPLKSIYASVTRQRIDDSTAFFPHQKMTRMEALKSYTLDNAYAAFMENEIGSLSPGKYADFIVCDTDLLNCSDEALLHAKIIKTFISGKLKYSTDEGHQYKKVEEFPN